MLGIVCGPRVLMNSGRGLVHAGRRLSYGKDLGNAYYWRGMVHAGKGPDAF